jgi:hypothetical protein
MHALPCLADTPPTNGHEFAVLFAAIENAAELFTPEEAEGLLSVLANLPGYAPAPQVGASTNKCLASTKVGQWLNTAVYTKHRPECPDHTLGLTSRGLLGVAVVCWHWAQLWSRVSFCALGVSTRHATSRLGRKAQAGSLILPICPAPAAAVQVAQGLLTTALQPPMVFMTGRRLTQMLMAAKELGAAPLGDEMQRVEAFYSSEPEW